MFGPRDLPADLAELWNKALRGIRQSPIGQKRYTENGMEVLIGSPADLKAMIVGGSQEVGRCHPVPRACARTELDHNSTSCGRRAERFPVSSRRAPAVQEEQEQNMHASTRHGSLH